MKKKIEISNDVSESFSYSQENDKKNILSDNKNKHQKNILTKKKNRFDIKINIPEDENSLQNEKYFKNKIFNSKSLGIVIYAEPFFYSDVTEENKNLHIQYDKKVLLLNLLKSLYTILGGDKILEESVIGHEHGDKLNKCHMQIFLKFEQKIRNHIKPNHFIINDTKLLYMTQHCKSPLKLKQYCKKEKDYIEYNPYKNLRSIMLEEKLIGEFEDVIDPFDILFKNRNLENNEIIKIFQNTNSTEYKRDGIIHINKIISNYNNFIKNKTSDLKFEWKFPPHIINYLTLPNYGKKHEIYKHLYSWFKIYCEPNSDTIKRRKALFIASVKGGLGKSSFARGLVPEEKIGISPFYIYCRGTLDASEFIAKEKTAKLIILDDINYTGNDIEIWKALTVSEPTNIRSPYHNYKWEKSLPCILLTNNMKTFHYWITNPELKTRCIFVSINFYMGPPGTEIPENEECTISLTDDVKNKLNEINNSKYNINLFN